MAALGAEVFAAADLAAGPPRDELAGPGLRVALLLVVFVGIVKNRSHGSCLLSRASLLRCFFLRHFLAAMDRGVNLLRLGLIHTQNLDQI